MNRYLMLSAAALFATATTSAFSTPKSGGSVHLVAHSPGGNSYCDTYTVNWRGNQYADQVDWTPCSISSRSYGLGIAGKTKGIGKNVALFDSYLADVFAGYMVDWQFALPFKSGNVFNAYYTTNGTTVIEYIAGGSYQIAAAPAHLTHLSTADVLPRRVIKR